MPLTAATRPAPRLLGGQGTLMARCLQAGLPVASSCSGRGICGKCAVEVLAGADALEAVAPLEAQVLKQNRIPAGWRLSCQCKALDTDAEILIRTGYW